jgi:hypothetical protein
MNKDEKQLDPFMQGFLKLPHNQSQQKPAQPQFLPPQAQLPAQPQQPQQQYNQAPRQAPQQFNQAPQQQQPQYFDDAPF